MAMAETALDSNNTGKIRTALAAVAALQWQTINQARRRAYRAPAILSCSVCGQPVAVRRRPPLGQPVYCRGRSRCRMRAFRARQGEAPVTVTPNQAPEFPLERGSVQVSTLAEPLDQTPQPSPEQVYPAAFWLATRAG